MLTLNIKIVHQSKGLECDNVILINLKNWKAGFPNKMVDDPVLNFVKRNGDFSYAEERRLFYVALTRTKIMFIYYDLILKVRCSFRSQN